MAKRLFIFVQICYNNSRTRIIGVWPSGKAPGFGPGIRGFESLHPSHVRRISSLRSVLLVYPLDTVSPVQKYKGFLKKIDRFLKFTTEYTEGGAFLMPRSLGVEIARFRKYPEEQRKDNLNRAVVKHGFFMPIQNLQITRYFDYHTVTRYIAAKYRLRQYAIEEFNKQILYLVQQKK